MTSSRLHLLCEGVTLVMSCVLGRKHRTLEIERTVFIFGNE